MNPVPSMRDVFSPAIRKDVDTEKPNDVEENPIVGEMSKAFGAIERGINEARYIIERIPGIDHEFGFRHMDELADHAYESWRRLIYGEPMVRWTRQSKATPDKDQGDL